MQDNDIRQKTLSNLIWRFAEQFGAKGVYVIVSIVLARIISPDAYGTIALVTVIITILQVFVDSGLGNALIQKKNADDLDFSTVFYFNVAVCLILYAGLFAAAPLVARFYKMPELTALVRVLGLTVVVSGIKNVQQAYVSRNLLFKRFFFATLGGTIFSAFLGVWLAYRDYGIWALVAQQISNVAIDTLILWVTIKWKPKLMFSFDRLKTLFSFGWKLLASALLSTIYSNIRQLIIGNAYSSADLAFYNKGEQFPNLITININSSIDSVLLPVMSQEQDDSATVKNMTRKAIRTSSYVMWPMMVGLAVIAEPLVSFVLTDKWLPCVPYLQIFCFVYALWPIHTANLNAIKAMGRSDIFLKLEIVKKLVGILFIIITVPFGVFAMSLGYLVTEPVGVLINAFPNKKLLNYSFREQVVDLLPFIFMSVIMGVVIWPIHFLVLPDIAKIALQVIFGILIYVAESKMLHIDIFEEYMQLLKNMISKRRSIN